MTKTKASKNKAAKKSNSNDGGCSSTSINEVKSIFDTLNKCKKLDTSNGKLVVKEKNKNLITKKNVRASELQSTRKKDGLYHEPELSLKMSDTCFFDGVDEQEEQEITSTLKGRHLRKKQAKGKTKNVTSHHNDDNNTNETDANLLRNEGVDRIVSMRSLQKMLSHNPKAGTTPNCPFDCDCCFEPKTNKQTKEKNE